MAPSCATGGAYVLDGDGSELLSRPIGIGCALEVRDFVACEVPDVCCMAYGYHTWVTADRSDPRVRREEAIVGVESVEGALEDRFSERGLHKFLLVGDPASIERAEREVGAAFPNLTAVRSSPILCEVMDGRVSKAEGIEVVCRSLGVRGRGRRRLWGRWQRRGHVRRRGGELGHGQRSRRGEGGRHAGHPARQRP